MDFRRIESGLSLRCMKKHNGHFRAIVTLFLVSLCIVSCESNSPTGPGNLSPYEIQGTVLDTDGNLLTDVNLYLVYNLTDAPAGLSKINSGSDSTVYLNQNFPNPFNDATNISFNIPARGFVKLFISAFKSDDTLKSFVNGTLEKGFYSLLLDEVLSNNLYSCNLWFKDSSGLIFQDEILMLKNNDLPDSLTAEGNPNYELFNSSFNINYASIPFGETVLVTESSPDVLDSKIITRDLTFVLTKTGYKNLVETHPINSSDNTKVIFRMEKI